MFRDEYYSQRNNLNDLNIEINLEQLKKLFLTIYGMYLDKEYFREHIGYYDGDYFYVGKLGDDDTIKNKLYIKLFKENLWPMRSRIDHYSEDDLFDIIEFCYDIISKPVYNDSLRKTEFIKETAQEEFRNEINNLLGKYNGGFKINEYGDIIKSLENGFEFLVHKKLPTDDEKIIQRVNQAINDYRDRKSSVPKRTGAVRHLADVLEGLKAKAELKITKKDESDLFHIVNAFGIRHNNEKQQNDYDKDIWLDWMFYYYLATIYACLHLIKR
jgi:hypothetical protein